MSTIAERIRTERERLGLSQEKFGALGGVQRRAQINYEKGERQPDTTYLAALATAGADVTYILTGERSGALKPDEAALLDNYRNSPEAGREAVRKTAFAFAQPEMKKGAA